MIRDILTIAILFGLFVALGVALYWCVELSERLKLAREERDAYRSENEQLRANVDTPHIRGCNCIELIQFECADCKRTVGHCMGAADDHPDLCDDCANERERIKRAVKGGDIRHMSPELMRAYGLGELVTEGDMRRAHDENLARKACQVAMSRLSDTAYTSVIFQLMLDRDSVNEHFKQLFDLLNRLAAEQSAPGADP